GWHSNSWGVFNAVGARSPAHEFLASRARNPAHELFGSRKLRLAPQDYSPWTPPSDRLSGRSYPPASRHGLEQPSRSTRWTCREFCTRQSRTWSAPRRTNVALTARSLTTPASRGCGLATDQKAVRTRGPGRVVLGSKPQLATTKNNSCAGLRALLAKNS